MSADNPDQPENKSETSDAPRKKRGIDTSPPKSSSTKPTREDKLAEALRANLRRRKQATRKNEDS